MPGGGKSTVGRQLAKRLQRKFFDSDQLIEQLVGCSINSFFEQKGEESFRDIEQQVIAQQVQLPNTVLATGGGVVLRPANRVALSTSSLVVYLRSSPEEIYKRV